MADIVGEVADLPGGDQPDEWLDRFAIVVTVVTLSLIVALTLLVTCSSTPSDDNQHPATTAFP